MDSTNLKTSVFGDAFADKVSVQPWQSELTLKIFVILVSLSVWVSLTISIFGILYVVLIGIFFFMSHLMFVAMVRGSAVRLGPDQFPDLYKRVELLSRRAGLEKIPEAYLMQAGGSLNALATKFLKSHMIVLFSDLLDACEDNDAARDMIIGHEIGHIKEKHLDWLWFLLPGVFVPFLGSAYSRAREYTCDRYGWALCNKRPDALQGLAILAAGGKQGKHVNLQTFVRQRESLNTGFMTLAKWLSGYPMLSERLLALDNGLMPAAGLLIRGRNRAIGILTAFIMVPTIVGALVVIGLAPKIKSYFKQAAAKTTAVEETDDSTSVNMANVGMGTIAACIIENYGSTGALPEDSSLQALKDVWASLRPDQEMPTDPFDGKNFGYTAVSDTSFMLWSAGVDCTGNTDDDITNLYDAHDDIE